MNSLIKKFTKSISVVSLGAFIYYALFFLANILFARFLPIEDFGKFKYAYVVFETLSFIILVIFGYSGMMKYASDEKNTDQRKLIISSWIWMVLFIFCIHIGILFLLKDYLMSWFGFGSLLFTFVLIIFFEGTASHIMEYSFVSCKHFGRYATARIIESCIFFFTILALFFLGKLSLEWIIWMTLIAQVISMIIFFIKIKDYLSFKISFEWIKKILTYNIFMFVPAFSLMLFGVINKFLTKFFLGFEGLGYLEIYVYCAVGITSALLNVFFTAFLPHYIGHKDKRYIVKLISKILMILAIPSIIGLLLGSWIIIKFFMNKPFFFTTALLCSFYGFIYMAFCIYDKIVKFYELKSLKSLNKGYIFALVIMFISGLLLIPLFGITGAVLSNIAGQCVLILCCLKIIKRDIIG